MSYRSRRTTVTNHARRPTLRAINTDDLDSANFQGSDNVTVTLELANGKIIVLSNAWFAGEGKVECEEGEITVRFESRKQAVEQK